MYHYIVIQGDFNISLLPIGNPSKLNIEMLKLTVIINLRDREDSFRKVHSKLIIVSSQ